MANLRRARNKALARVAEVEGNIADVVAAVLELVLIANDDFIAGI